MGKGTLDFDDQLTLISALDIVLLRTDDSIKITA
jgi:hypothetical protein